MALEALEDAPGGVWASGGAAAAAKPRQSVLSGARLAKKRELRARALAAARAATARTNSAARRSRGACAGGSTATRFRTSGAGP